MRCLIRILGRVGVGISVLLCLAMIGLWIWSYRPERGWIRWRFFASNNTMDESQVGLLHGGVECSLARTHITTKDLSVEEQEEDGVHKTLVKIRNMGFRYPNGWQRYWAVHLLPEHWWEHLGIFVRPGEGGHILPQPVVWSTLYVRCPYWLPALLTALWPGISLVRWWRRKRLLPGLCVNCGYDLRASPERCPECGAVSAEMKA